MTFEKLDPSKRYSYQDYYSWTFEEQTELYNGQIVPISKPNRRHQEIFGQLAYRLGMYLKNKEPRVYFAPFDVRLPLNKVDKSSNVYTVVQPDICVIYDLEKLDDAGCLGAPDLIVEILSPGNVKKEFKQKKEVYENNGVTEYWLIHPTDEYLLQYYLENGKYNVKAYFFDEDIVQSVVLADFSVVVSDVLS